VHLVDVEGNDAAADQVERVADYVLLPEPDHLPGKQVPVHADRDRDLGEDRDGNDVAVVAPGPPSSMSTNGKAR
jgi:hypothetical protein